MIIVLLFVFALILSLIITPAARKLGIEDKPNYRKIHDKPIPKGGGIGIFIPVLLLEVIILLFFKTYITLDVFKYITIMFVTVVLTALGLIDDKLELGSKIKLCIQLAVTILTLTSGIGFDVFGIEVLDLLLTAVWIIGIMNAVNLIDGLDGLAAGIAVISCVGFVIIGYAFGDITITLLSLIIMGGCLGFLKYNFRPARIFMGDTGSVPLGYNLAVIGILCNNAISGKTSVIIPMLMLGIPIFDTLLTFARRVINHKPIFMPDRSHFYNLMFDLKGIGHKSTVIIIYAVNIVFVALSCTITFLDDIWRIVSICVIIATACLLSIKMGFIHKDSRIKKAIELNHINWILYNGALVPDVPPHIEIDLTREEAKYLLKNSKAYFLRWPSDFDCGFKTEWWYLIRDKGIDLDEFNSGRRWEIKNGIKRCIVKKVDAEYIANNGYDIYISAFESYNTFQKPAGREEFYDSMISKKGNSVFDFWAAFDRADNNIIAYFMNRLGPDCCMYSTAKFKPEFLKLYVSQALIYEMTNYYLNELGFKYVYNGARSISHKTNVQDFLIDKLHFRKAYCKLNVVYSPIVKIIVHVLYPFRNVISKINMDSAKKITVLLLQEEIRRSFSQNEAKWG